jgi:hypothetical protein
MRKISYKNFSTVIAKRKCRQDGVLRSKENVRERLPAAARAIEMDPVVRAEAVEWAKVKNTSKFCLSHQAAKHFRSYSKKCHVEVDKIPGAEMVTFANFGGKTFVHTSGVGSAEFMKALKRKGVNVTSAIASFRAPEDVADLVSGTGSSMGRKELKQRRNSLLKSLSKKFKLVSNEADIPWNDIDPETDIIGWPEGIEPKDHIKWTLVEISAIESCLKDIRFVVEKSN